MTSGISIVTYRLDGSTVDTPIQIIDQDDNRVGIMTGSGPMFAADPLTVQAIKERNICMANAEKAILTEKAKESRDQRMRELLDLTLVSPDMITNNLNDLTMIERRIIEAALRQSHFKDRDQVQHIEGYDSYTTTNDCVSLPYVLSCLSRRSDMANSTQHAIEVSLHRAAKRLYNRGLATVEKRQDGLIWCTVSRERIHQIVTKEISKKFCAAEPTFNLIKEDCEIPTSSPEEQKKRPRTDPLAMPKRASPQRLAACRLLTGIKTLERPDKVEINYHFDTYSQDINEKIIALLDLRTGDVVGSEYSTRFNDISKAAANLDKFDFAIENSFKEHSRAVFLTLTTDPNLTDGERESNHRRKLENVRSQLRNTKLPKKQREGLEKQYYKLMGPDFEIEELDRKLSSGMLSKDQLPVAKQRLAKLKAEKKTADELWKAVKDEKTPIRTKEKMVTSLKKMNRWEYKHDPNGFQALWDANRHFAKAWNKFLSYLTKNNDGIRPQYIATYEFTESGLMHVHSIIFCEFLMSNDQISREWRRCGQGEISYIYGLKAVKKRDGLGWEWRWKSSMSRPADTKGMSGGDYLKKYVRKCLLAMMDDYTSPSEIQSLYWAFNKRFFTNSRALLEGIEKNDTVAAEEKLSEAAYVFFQILHESEAPERIDKMVYYRVRPGWQKGKDGPPDEEDCGGIQV